MSKLRRMLGRWRQRWFMVRLGWRNRGRTGSEVFSRYWAENHWRNAETRSGDGSTLAYTESLRRELPGLLTSLQVRTLLDLPCGDFHWMSRVPLPAGLRYIGADIVPGLIAQMQATYGSESRSFCTLDATRGELPAADLWLCRDLLFHLPHEDVWALLERFAQSDVKALLITSHAATEGVNRDTFVGGFRLINLRLPPFSLPEPEARVSDWIDGHPERWLLLYRREVLQDWLKAQRRP